MFRCDAESAGEFKHFADGDDGFLLCATHKGVDGARTVFVKHISYHIYTSVCMCASVSVCVCCFFPSHIYLHMLLKPNRQSLRHVDGGFGFLCTGSKTDAAGAEAVTIVGIAGGSANQLFRWWGLFVNSIHLLEHKRTNTTLYTNSMNV